MGLKRRVIKNVLLFAMLAMVFNGVAFWFLAEPVLYSGYFVPKQQLGTHSSFLLGDSHAKVIRQQDLDRINTTNFAFHSDSYFDVYNKLHYLINTQEVDTLFICVDDHTLSVYRQWWTNSYRSIRYADYKHYNRYYPTNFRSFLFLKYVSIYMPLFDTRHSEVLGKKVVSLFRGENPRSFDTYDFSEVAVERRIERSKDRISTQYPEPVASESLTACLNELISLSKTEEITLIGIKFPLTREFYDELGDRSYKADSIFISNGLPVLDFKELFPDSISYFKDQDHLNHKGSEVFMELMKRDLDSR